MRKPLWISSVVFIVLFGSLQLYLWSKKPTDPNELKARARKFPSLRLTTLDGATYAIPPGKKFVMVYFNSMCDHCGRQIQAMKARSEIFKDTRLVLMSSQASDELAAFAAALDFPSTAGVHVVHVGAEEIAEKFGVLALPQIFVYDANGNLAGLFAGETDPVIIASILNDQN